MGRRVTLLIVLSVLASSCGGTDNSDSAGQEVEPDSEAQDPTTVAGCLLEDGSTPKRLTTDGVAVSSEFSPDGSRIAFEAALGGPADILVMDGPPP